MPYFRLPDVFYTKPSQPDLRVKYGKKPMQHITVRIPDGDGPHPTLLTIHGGKWKSTYRAKQLEYLCADLVEHGIACCNIEFVRLGHVGGGYPNTFIDLYDAIEFILSHADEWNLKTDQISLLGHSSGAHLACCLCAEPQDLGFTSQSLGFTPHSVISLAGVFDLDAAERLKPEIDQFFGENPVLSPINLLPINTKQLVMCGSKDKLLEQATKYTERAKLAGDDASVLVIDKCSHFRIIDPTFEEWPQIRMAIKQMVLYLKDQQ